MKTTKMLNVCGFTVRGTDLRDGSAYEDFIVLDKPEGPVVKKAELTYIEDRIRAAYAEKGYRVHVIERGDEYQVELDLTALYGNWYWPSSKPSAEVQATAEQLVEEPEPAVISEPLQEEIASPPEAEPAEAVETPKPDEQEPAAQTETGEPPSETLKDNDFEWFKPDAQPKKKGASARLFEYIRQHPEQSVLKRIADATDGKLTEDNIRDMVNGKAQCGHWFTTVGIALDKLNAETNNQQDVPPEPTAPKKTRKGVLPKFWPDSGTADGLGEIDEDKLRRKTRAALVNWVAKHGRESLKTITRSTINRVNEKTLLDMVNGTGNPSLTHYQAVDKALKNLALKEIENA